MPATLWPGGESDNLVGANCYPRAGLQRGDDSPDRPVLTVAGIMPHVGDGGRPRRRRRGLLLGAAVLVLAGLLVTRPWVTPPGGSAGQVQATHPLVGEPAPPLSGPTLDGGELDLASLRGNVVVVAVWAAWCAPCREELPVLVAAERQWRDRGLRLIGIDTRDGERQARELLAEVGGDPGSSIADPRGRHTARWGAPGVPTTFVVDADGRVAAVRTGPVDAGWIDAHAVPLLPGGAR